MTTRAVTFLGSEIEDIYVQDYTNSCDHYEVALEKHEKFCSVCGIEVKSVKEKDLKFIKGFKKEGTEIIYRGKYCVSYERHLMNDYNSNKMIIWITNWETNSEGDNNTIQMIDMEGIKKLQELDSFLTIDEVEHTSGVFTKSSYCD